MILMLATVGTASAQTLNALTPEQMNAMQRWPTVLILGVACIIMGGFNVMLATQLAKMARENGARMSDIVRSQETALASVTTEYRRSINEFGQAQQALVQALATRPCFVGDLSQLVSDAVKHKVEHRPHERHHDSTPV